MASATAAQTALQRLQETRGHDPTACDPNRGFDGLCNACRYRLNVRVGSAAAFSCQSPLRTTLVCLLTGLELIEEGMAPPASSTGQENPHA